MDTCESMTNWVSRPDMTITVDWVSRVKNRVSNHGALRPQKPRDFLGLLVILKS